jgi:hypothetical protein
MATLKMANMTPSKMAVNMTPSNSVLPSNIESNISMEISEITSEHKRGMRLNTTERPTRSSKKNNPTSSHVKAIYQIVCTCIYILPHYEIHVHAYSFILKLFIYS